MRKDSVKLSHFEIIVDLFEDVRNNRIYGPLTNFPQ